MALPVSRLVRVVINLAPTAAARRSFGVLMVAGDSDVINGLERFRTYESVEGVALDFGVEAPEYKAAAAYFGQTPKPRTIMIGRWIRSASAAQNIGGILSTAQQSISNWSAISNGGFVIVVDGVTKTLSALDFSGVTNLNGVATVINAALTGAEISWNGSQFTVTSDSTGDGVKAAGTITLTGNPSYGARATNTIELTGQPTAGNTVVIQGTTVTFVSGTPGANEVEIGLNTAETADNLLAFLQNSADANIALMTYAKIGNIVTATARVYGTAGNAYTLTKVGANITVGGATFSGGVAPDTLAVNGTLFTFVSAYTTGSQILVGPTEAATAANIKAILSASVVAGVAEATYTNSDNVVTVTYKTAGTAGNAFTLTESSSAITVTATLSGGAVASSVGYATAGSGTDISSLLKLTSSTSIALVDGYDAETPVECAAVLSDKSNAWYGLMFQASVQPTNEQSLDVSAFIEALDVKRIYGVTITDTSVLSSLVSNDLASLQSAAGYLRSFCQYSENAYAIASLFGRIFTVNFNAQNSTITLMYKQEPSIVPAALSTTQANTLKAKRCNVFVEYDNDTAIIQYGVMSGSAYIDEIHNLDWFQNAVQNACYNLNYTSPTKIPQTDAGSNQFVNVINGVCEEAVNNGMAAGGVWTSTVEFGQLKTGMYLKSGYYVYVQPMALQSQADREQRICPPIQIAIKLAGAIQEIDAIIQVNR